MQVGVPIDAVRIEVKQSCKNRSKSYKLHISIDSRVSDIMGNEMVSAGRKWRIVSEHSSEELISGDVIRAPIYPKGSIRACEHA